jgi:hypothetical protein
LITADSGRYAGRKVWLFPHSGKQLPFVSGADGEATPPATPPTPPAPPATPPVPPSPAPPADPPPPTAADTKKIASDAAKEARAKLLADLGVESEDELKTVVKSAKDAEEAAKDEATKAIEAAQRDAAAAKAKEAEAANTLRTARVELGLVRAGVKPERLEKSGLLVATVIATDADEEAVKAAIETFKTDTPEWFGAGAAAPAPSGVPGQQPPANQPGVNGIDTGAARAKAEREKRLGGDPFGGLQPLAAAPGTSNGN